MESLTALKVAHVLALVLLLGSAMGLAVWTWRARRGGDAAVYGRLLARPQGFLWLLMGVCLASLPFTGWWLVHRVGWPLGQTWVLGSSLLYTFGALAWFWLLTRVNRLRTEPAKGKPQFTLALALFSGVCFLAIAGLMGARPV
ncbi:DUF2269 family protein [Pseudomonas japonica]|uniref:Uncharacterized membrane protein n=1 Tax=Pseudomonas japonica TaxID=256466 RepID=A0A239CFQ1_9PSED|nr:DUF2269 family protein [Pseudomonas japonica]SNS18153.1 Uncharacterized membrane protein [Pseudomonas japonica]